MISSPDVTRYHNANFSKQRGVFPTEIYILKQKKVLRRQSIRGKLLSIESRTWYPHHFFKTLGPASSIMDRSSALPLYLPPSLQAFDQVVLMWRVAQRAWR
jgi:hypothetical protein